MGRTQGRFRLTTGRRWWQLTLALSLLWLLVEGPALAQAPPPILERPVWSTGDWWEGRFSSQSELARFTVVGKTGDS